MLLSPDPLDREALKTWKDLHFKAIEVYKRGDRAV